MTWIVPAMERPEPPHTGTERRLLESWLDHHRATFLMKCEGLDGERLAHQAVPPSDLTLQGLMRHLAGVERGWFRGGWDPGITSPLHDLSEDPDADLHNIDPSRAEDDFTTLIGQVDLARAEAARHQLDDEITAPWRDHAVSLRWIYLHMIEEYARHNGHADLLREAIDGRTGS